MNRLVLRLVLEVASAPRVVDEDVFDAWSWCPSDTLVWHRPASFLGEGRVDASNPNGFLFLVEPTCTFLPRELASLHARGLPEDAWSLAPWGIDDATDGLHAHRVRPRDVLSLYAATLPALVWGLHDWAHFHNHGPFTRRAETELECDLAAFRWLRANAAAIGVTEAVLFGVGEDLLALSAARFAEEDRPFAIASSAWRTHGVDTAKAARCG